MQYTHSFDDIDFLIRTSTPKQIAEKYGLSPDEVTVVAIANLMDNPPALADYLAALVPQIEEEVAEAPAEAPEEFEAQRVDFGYEVAARGRFVFIRPCSTDHPARIVFPKSHQSDQDIGFIHASQIADLPQGTLVCFDRFAAIGAAFDVIDDSGEPCFVVQVDEAAVSGVLKRKELD